MPDFTVTLSPAAEKAMLSDVVSIQEWLDNALHVKSMRCIDVIVETHSDLQASKLPLGDKMNIVLAASFKSAAERLAEFEASSP